MELPECPVCLQNYDGDSTIPRVLACGHSACQDCLLKLPQRYAQTIRCPACTQLVKFPPQGPSVLPKNIDLLSLCLSQNPNPNPNSNTSKQDHRFFDFLPRFWSDEFYASWNDWVLPNDAVLVDKRVDEERGAGFCTVFWGKIDSSSKWPCRVCFGNDQRVSLVRVGSLMGLGLDDPNLKVSYVVRVLKCLSGMREELRDELGLILRASVRQCRKMGKVYGLWGDLDDGFLYMVSERMDGSFLEKLGDLSNGFCGEDGDGLSTDGVSGFALIGIEMVEAMVSLHSEGFIAGCVGFSCFSFDYLGHGYVDMNEVLVTGRKIRKSIADVELEVAIGDLLEDNAFMSPELWLELLQNKGTGLERDKSRYSIGYSSDVWSLACLLLRILLGKLFTEEFPNMIEEKGSDYLTLHSIWTERVSSLLDTQLGSEYAGLKDILLKCLVYDPEGRPLLTELRKCIRELITKPQFDLASLDGAVQVSTSCCIILGELCQFPKELSKTQQEDALQGREAAVEADFGPLKEDIVDKNLLEGLFEGLVKFKDLQGHRDCITGITVGGGFLFSSSLDKTIRVWSLQDFSHVHTFEGHEHKVMAIIFVNQEQPLCISGDSGGGIFVWGLSTPLGQEPLKKWYEQKDWRYSGIHALCLSSSGYVYTGCGDKSIKAWSLRDGLLECTMNGHKSVVSTLAICDEVLYSGSWDGTIRLWSLSDHTALTAVGEETSAVTSVLSLAVDRHMLIAAYENGCIKVWRNEVFMKSMQLHQGAIFATGMEGKWLFTGGWDKTLNIQELSGDEFHVDPRPIGSIPCSSVITALLFWQGKLFVGYADRLLKVYYCGK
ncbi:Guanine nucleotide-binding protein, beta subunit [Trema orientale]|uniref:Guanine nucleotide-binding protein, beta subunit n=1 Tax=Trema orientale TaxID=63057 RepID=A0A2P5F177_TREOI|nr:Guanine nucleotide-binding protein, beta subunit [Trema orientale]